MTELKLTNLPTQNYKLVSEACAAEMLSRSVGTLKNWRSKGCYQLLLPAFATRDGVKYLVSDVHRFRDARPRKTHLYPRIRILLEASCPTDIQPDAKLSAKEFSVLCKVSPSSIAVWQWTRKYADVLPFSGSGLSATYSGHEILAFIDAGRKYWDTQSELRNKPYKLRHSGSSSFKQNRA